MLANSWHRMTVPHMHSICEHISSGLRNVFRASAMNSIPVRRGKGILVNLQLYYDHDVSSRKVLKIIALKVTSKCLWIDQECLLKCRSTSEMKPIENFCILIVRRVGHGDGHFETIAPLKDHIQEVSYWIDLEMRENLSLIPKRCCRVS